MSIMDYIIQKGIDSSLISSLHKFKYKFYFNDQKNWKKDFLKTFKNFLSFRFSSRISLSYPLWKLAETARKKVKVVVSGEGADELFGLYKILTGISEWELKNKFTSYKYLFNKFYDDYLDSFAKITSRNRDIDLVKSIIKPYFDGFDDPINAMCFADFKIVMPSLLANG